MLLGRGCFGFINFGFAEYEEEKEVTQQIEKKQSPPARGRGLKLDRK